MRIHTRRILPPLLALFLAAFLALPVLQARSAPQAVSTLENEHLVYIYAGKEPVRRFTPPPALLKTDSPPTSDIVINYVGNWPAEAQAVFEYVAGIWESLLVSPVPIVVRAEWSSNLPPGALGGAGPNDVFNDFPSAPVADTLYPIALANSLAGEDLLPDVDDFDIIAVFSSTFNWYYGTDGNTPVDKYDLASVVLHEFAHGLGFIGSMREVNESAGLFGWGYTCIKDHSTNICPIIYDRFSENYAGQSLLNETLFPNPSTQLADQLTSDQVFFDGPYTNAANGERRAKLFAPDPWMPGSSFAHLDGIYDATQNALMTYSIAPGEANHSPGPIVLGMFKDIGWDITVLPPVVTPTHWVYLPAVSQDLAAIDVRGEVTLNGSPAADTRLQLRIDDGTGTWATQAEVFTHKDGSYAFNNVPPLGSNQRYYVRFYNQTEQAGRLYVWGTRVLRAGDTTGDVQMSAFDIADIALISPAQGVTITLPHTFQWTPRPASPGDNYELSIYEYQGADWWSGALGHVGQYELESIPDGFSSGVEYLWEVWADSPDGGYGISLGNPVFSFAGETARTLVNPEPDISADWKLEAFEQRR